MQILDLLASTIVWASFSKLIYLFISLSSVKRFYWFCSFGDWYNIPEVFLFFGFFEQFLLLWLPTLCLYGYLKNVLCLIFIWFQTTPCTETTHILRYSSFSVVTGIISTSGWTCTPPLCFLNVFLSNWESISDFTLVLTKLVTTVLQSSA